MTTRYPLDIERKMTTKVIQRPLICCLKTDQRWRLWPVGRYFDLSRTQVVLLVVSCLLARAAYIQGYKPNHETHGHKDHSCKVDPNKDIDSNAVAFPGDDQEEDAKKKEDNSVPASPTGQRVAGHLLAVLLLASVAAAIIEAVRARMAQCKSPPKSNDQAGKESEAHHSSASVHSAPGKIPRRALQEKSHSQDSTIPRARSSSAGVTSHKEGAAAAAASALAASRAQKALRARLLGGRPLPLGGKPGAVPPLLRRSSFPVMTRGSTSGKDSNNSSPSMLSRKQSVDLGDDDLGDFQKRRVRIIRRF